MEFTYMNETIAIDDRGVFSHHAVGNHTSLDSCKEAIKKDKAESAKFDLNLTVLNQQGDVILLRRIHQGTRNWLTDKSAQFNGKAYHNTPEARAAIAEVGRIHQLAILSDKEMARYSMNLPSPKYSRDFDMAEMQERARSMIEAGPQLELANES